MSRLLAYMGSDPERLGAALLEHRSQLIATVPQFGDGAVSWGVGFYQGGEVLLQRRPRISGNTIDLYDSLKTLRTDTFLAQVKRLATAKLAKNENVPPFRFRSWLMAQLGMTPTFESQRDTVYRLLPDFLLRNIRGQTESEALFHVFLAALHEAGRGQMEDANLPPEATLQSLLHALGRFQESIGPTDPPPAVVAVTNGRSMVVLRYGPVRLWLRRLGPHLDQARSQDQFRGSLLVAGEDIEASGGMEEVPDRHAVLVGRDLNARVVAI